MSNDRQAQIEADVHAQFAEFIEARDRLERDLESGAISADDFQREWDAIREEPQSYFRELFQKRRDRDERIRSAATDQERQDLVKASLPDEQRLSVVARMIRYWTAMETPWRRTIPVEDE